MNLKKILLLVFPVMFCSGLSLLAMKNNSFSVDSDDENLSPLPEDIVVDVIDHNYYVRVLQQDAITDLIATILELPDLICTSHNIQKKKLTITSSLLANIVKEKRAITSFAREFGKKQPAMLGTLQLLRIIFTAWAGFVDAKKLLNKSFFDTATTQQNNQGSKQRVLIRTTMGLELIMRMCVLWLICSDGGQFTHFNMEHTLQALADMCNVIRLISSIGIRIQTNTKKENSGTTEQDAITEPIESAPTSAIDSEAAHA